MIATHLLCYMQHMDKLCGENWETFSSAGSYTYPTPLLFISSYAMQPFKAYCTIWVRRSNFRHQASPRLSPRESTQRRKVELWARKFREFCLNADYHVTFKYLLHAVKLRHGFYFPSEGRCAQNFFALKIRRLRQGVNPQTWVPKASTLPLDHRSYHYSFKDAASWKLRCRFLHRTSTSDSRLPLQTAVTPTHNNSLVRAVNIQSRSEVRKADCHSHSSFEFSPKHCVSVAIPQHEPSDTAQWRNLNYIWARITIHWFSQTLQKKFFAPPWNVSRFHPPIIMLMQNPRLSFKAA
jgi:hypothetical protein